METVTAFPLERYRARVEWMYARGIDPTALRSRVIAVAGAKGGIGKTTLAIELAYLLGGALLDFEWDDGSASVALGVRPDRRMRAPLLDALESGRSPRLVPGGPWRPDLVPGHKDFEAQQPSGNQTADLVEGWASEWGRELGCCTTIDTHPGGSPSTLGAVAAAHVTVLPAVLAEKQMEALAGLLHDLRDYPLLVIPMMVRKSPPARYIEWLRRITAEAEVPVGPMIRRYDWLETRARRMALTAAGRPVAKRAEPLVAELRNVGEAVAKYVIG